MTVIKLRWWLCQPRGEVSKPGVPQLCHHCLRGCASVWAVSFWQAQMFQSQPGYQEMLLQRFYFSASAESSNWVYLVSEFDQMPTQREVNIVTVELEEIARTKGKQGSHDGSWIIQVGRALRRALVKQGQLWSPYRLECKFQQPSGCWNELNTNKVSYWQRFMSWPSTTQQWRQVREMDEVIWPNIPTSVLIRAFLHLENEAHSTAFVKVEFKS